MSQYPSPYVPPNVVPYHGGPPDALAPARRASMMMFILGTLMILFSGCMVGITFLFSMVPVEQLQPLRERIESIAQVSPEFLFRVLGTLIFVIGAVLFALAFFVRRGGLVSAIIATVLVGLIELQQLLSLAGAIAAAKDFAGLGSLVASAITFAAFTLQFVWLIRATRAAPKVKTARQQYSSQYWQYHQNMQAYSGYPAQPQAQGYATQSDGNVPPANQ